MLADFEDIENIESFFIHLQTSKNKSENWTFHENIFGECYYFIYF